jgi:hypothetical protein
VEQKVKDGAIALLPTRQLLFFGVGDPSCVGIRMPVQPSPLQHSDIFWQCIGEYIICNF